MLMSARDPEVRPLRELENASEFVARHIGVEAQDEVHMLSVIGAASRRALIDAIVPRSIARGAPMALPDPLTEAQALAELKGIASRNQVLKSFIGQGYFGTHTPGVILRNVLENPAWYTAYTPYQAEISQGRMEALVNFQTMVCELTGMAIAGSSMLDEATAAAEAMTLAMRVGKSKSTTLFVADDVLPQTLEVVRTRAKPIGVTVLTGPAESAGRADAFAVLLQYPGVNGVVRDLKPTISAVHAKGGLAIVAADLLSLVLLTPPGEMGADIVVGNTQRFGMPMGNGGPHAAYLATKDEFKRSMPGRLVGVSVDAHGAPAYRLALQTREQHIRREKATSNICTAQVLPAVVASMYAVYHGPLGLKRIAQRVASYTAVLAAGLKQLGAAPVNAGGFDTLEVACGVNTDAVLHAARSAGFNLRRASSTSIGITLDETTTRDDVSAICAPVRGRECGARFRALREGCGLADPDRSAPHQPVPDAPRLQQAPQRDRDAALHPQPVRQGPRARSHDDPARLVHDEAQRDQRDDPDHLARVREHPPVRTAGSARRLRRAAHAARSVAVPGHRLQRREPAAQRGLAGRVRRPAGDPRVPRGARSGPSQRSA